LTQSRHRIFLTEIPRWGFLSLSKRQRTGTIPSPEAGPDMQRRHFVKLLGGAAAAWPVAARAQQTIRIRKIGILAGQAANDPDGSARFAAFVSALQSFGWTEGRNISFEIRRAIGNPDQFRAMATELVEMKVDVIIAGSAGLASVAHQVTSTVPIVTTVAGELEGTGLIASLRRPGGNVTGMQILSPELMSKRMELLKQLVPALTLLGILEPITPAAITTAHYFEVLIDAAKRLQIQVHRVPVRAPEEFASAFSAMVQNGDQAALVLSNPLSYANRSELVRAAAESRLPTIYEVRPFVASGGLISYGPDFTQLARDAAIYVNEILKGVAAGEIPVGQPTKFQLVINLKTARGLGLTVPETFLFRADEVIE
jgi:putative ABC transport system substrate-binding protein